MKRALDNHLDQWSCEKGRKPLIVLGARQIGKTYSILEFGTRKFSKVHEFNFQANRSLHKIFSSDLDPHRIIRELEFISDQSIAVNGEDLLFFDEIQECPEAITSLKYFFEKMPQVSIVAAGSLLGLHLSPSSFPVGKVELFHMYPMSFQEFVENVGSARDQQVFCESLENPRSISEIAHEKFWLLFKCYLNTGGLPESINSWMNNGGVSGGAKAFKESRSRLASIVTSYTSDFTKHSGKINALHIERVWRRVALHLSSAQDGSSERFKFKDVLPGVNSYRDLIGPIDWLQKASMVINVPICHSISTPIKAFTKQNIFKLYMFDCGILGAILSIPPGKIMDFDFGTYKGYFAENFVAQEILACARNPRIKVELHSWSEGRAEIEFVIETDHEIIPIEVKSGGRIRARSLQSYIDRYKPKTSVVLSARPPTISDHNGLTTINLPLYLAGCLNPSNDMFYDWSS